MQTRRKFLGTAAGLPAAAFTAALSAAPDGGRIKKSILISMLPKELSYLDQFKLAVDVGFHEMEVRTVDSNDEAVKIKGAADQAGLRIHSVMNQAHWKYPLSSPDPKEVQASMQGMELSLNQAKLYGADAVLLVPAVVRDDTTYEQAWERSQKKIRELLPLAEKTGVIIAIEEVWNKFLLTARDFVQYIDEFNNPLVQAYVDVGNMVHYGVPQHWIRQAGKRIAKVHLKDYVRQTRQFVNLGEGDINWEEVRKSLADAGFTGNATVELRGGDRAYLVDISQRVDRLLGLG
jgi:L-ribulose-5-phosphate 3-epimerase